MEQQLSVLVGGQPCNDQAVFFSFAVIVSPDISIYPEENEVCIVCTFSANSASLGCVVLMHPVHNFSTIVVREIGTNASQPYCISVQEKGMFSVAVFEWRSDSFVDFQPVSVAKVLIDQENPTQSEKLCMPQLIKHFIMAMLHYRDFINHLHRYW